MENFLEIAKAGPSIFGHWVGHRVQDWAKVDQISPTWAKLGETE